MPGPQVSPVLSTIDISAFVEEGLTVVAQQEVRGPSRLTVHHGGMVVIDAVGEFRRRSEMAVAHVEMAEPPNVDIIVDAVVAVSPSLSL